MGTADGAGVLSTSSEDLQKPASSCTHIGFLPGEDHLLQALSPDLLDLLLNKIEEFITGVRHRADRSEYSPP